MLFLRGFSALIGALLYLAVTTRPDIASTVNKLAKYMSCPTVDHWKAAVGLVGYLKFTMDEGLHLGRSNVCTAYCDADYASIFFLTIGRVTLVGVSCCMVGLSRGKVSASPL
jgi:hypothetical protein